MIYLFSISTNFCLFSLGFFFCLVFFACFGLVCSANRENFQKLYNDEVPSIG